MCAAATQGSAPAHPNFERDVVSKAELVAGITASTLYCRSVFAQMTDEDMSTVVEFYQGPTPIGAVLAFNTAHSNEHYGNMVTYLRIKGVVPPSTARAQSARE